MNSSVNIETRRIKAQDLRGTSKWSEKEYAIKALIKKSFISASTFRVTVTSTCALIASKVTYTFR